MPLPALELHRLNGTDVDTTDLNGTPLIINIWYSTCLPCRRKVATGWFLDKAPWTSLAIGIGLIVLGVAMMFDYRLPFTTPRLGIGRRVILSAPAESAADAQTAPLTRNLRVPRDEALYTELLGVTPYFGESFGVGFNVKGHELALDPAGDAGKGPITYWGVNNIENALKRMHNSGATAHSPIRDVGNNIRVASTTDPTGNVLAIIEILHFRAATPSDATDGSGR